MTQGGVYKVFRSQTLHNTKVLGYLGLTVMLTRLVSIQSFRDIRRVDLSVFLKLLSIQ